MSYKLLAFIDGILTHNSISYISLAAFVLGIVDYQFDTLSHFPVSANHSTKKKLFFSVPVNRYGLIKVKKFFIIARSILFQNGWVESMSGDFFSTRKS